MTIAEHERLPEVTEQNPALEAKLHAMWESEPGLRGWFSTVDHKEIGIMYLVTAFAFLVAGGIEAVFMRLQLSGPNQHLLTPEQYNQLLDARQHDDLLVRVSGIVGFQQLFLAAAARRARHGVSPP